MKRSSKTLDTKDTMNEAITVFYTNEQYNRAVQRAKSHPDRSTDPQSITRGHGLLTGLLGEIIVEDYLRDQIAATDDDCRNIKDKLNYDIMLKDGTTLEVKSKGHSVLSCPNWYDASVSAINAKQKADYYVFVRIHGRKLRDCYGFDHSKCRKAWICGIVQKEEIIRPERLMKRGTVIRNSSYFDFKAKSNCYQIKIRELQALPKDFGKKIDLLSSGTLSWVPCQLPDYFASDENEYCCMGYKDAWTGGYFKGLSALSSKEWNHFNENIDTYAFYKKMQKENSELMKAKKSGWQCIRLKQVN